MPRQCRLADVVESQMSSLEGFDIERVLWKIYAQVPKVSQIFLSACSPEPLDSGHCWHVQQIKPLWAYSIFSLGFVFCLMLMYMFVPWLPIKAKALLKKVRDCEDAIYPFSSVMSPKHVCLRTVRYWLSPPTAAAQRLARSVSEISRRKGAASQHSRALELQALQLC